MNAREVAIRCTDGSTMRGKINIGPKSSRLSDWFYLNKDQFITVFDAALEGEMDKVVILNKNNIIWVMPLDE
ncbi:MAG: hypothetical protein JRG97_13375 [Deltaproteobacteria bacterium]|nr:hypothetical protein [Deltaproteobacteria bacterium]MBW2052798.1 hypothetical protein [Deltaproteobacteria bacterium]MBW2142037.1 hypothetical protein [Deltaproteobacteria bacterium]MBW2323829.1 hypothetical protein [Deltaproteobacteria bacterium]